MAKGGEIAAFVMDELQKKDKKMAEFFAKHEGQYTKLMSTISEAGDRGDKKGFEELYGTLRTKIKNDYKNSQG